MHSFRFAAHTRDMVGPASDQHTQIPVRLVQPPPVVNHLNIGNRVVGRKPFPGHDHVFDRT